MLDNFVRSVIRDRHFDILSFPSSDFVTIGNVGVGLMGGEKPGFCEDIRWEAKISEKTRFLRLCKSAIDRFFNFPTRAIDRC